MDHLTDEELIRKIQEDACSESLEILTKRHAGIFYTMAKRYANTSMGCSGVSLDDFQDNHHFIVYQAAKGFNPEKNTKFVTWLGNQVRYFCLNTIHAESKYYGAEPEKINFIINKANDEDVGREKMMGEASYVLEILEQIKDKRVKQIIEMRYFDENKKRRAFSFIAEKLGMSTQGVIDLHDNFIEFMRRKMTATENMDQI